MTTLAGQLAGLPPARVRKAPFLWRLRNFPHWFDGAWRIALATLVARLTHVTICYGKLSLHVTHGDGSITDYGVVGYKVFTTAGAGFVIDAFQNIVELEIMKYHAFGTGGAAEAVGNTGLTTELTTEYAVDNTRPTGTQTENGAAVYETVGVLDPDSAVAITEHGIMSQAAVGGGVLHDRTLFGVINLAAAGDTLTATYDFTMVTGS